MPAMVNDPTPPSSPHLEFGHSVVVGGDACALLVGLESALLQSQAHVVSPEAHLASPEAHLVSPEAHLQFGHGVVIGGDARSLLVDLESALLQQLGAHRALSDVARTVRPAFHLTGTRA